MPERVNSTPNTTRRLRLKGFDYRTPGFYFITICQKSRHHLFARIDHGDLRLLLPGQMARDVTSEVDTRFSNARVDASVVMPNHVHLLFGMNLDERTVNPDSVIDVVEWWKTQTTNRYIWGVRNYGWPRYDGSLWQEGYHDRIVRDQRELEYIRYYIEQNPKRWNQDTFFAEE